MNVFGEKQAVMKKARRMLREHGWVALSSNIENLTYTYSAGFSKRFKYPEIFIVGVGTHELNVQLINDFGKLLKRGRPEPTSYVNLPGFPNTFALGPVIPQEQARPLAPFGTELLGQPFDAMQMFLPDPNGLFPWDAEVHPLYRDYQSALFEPPAGIAKPKAN